MKHHFRAILILCLGLSACAVSPLCNNALPVELRSSEKYSWIGDHLDRVAPAPDASPDVLFPYYQCLARRDQIEAIYRVGLAYEMGHGVEPDIEKAIKYYRKAAKGDYGTRLEYIPADDDRPIGETREISVRDAQPKHTGAMYRLGIYYLERCKKERDIRTAKTWLLLSRRLGNEDAEQLLSFIESTENTTCDNQNVPGIEALVAQALKAQSLSICAIDDPKFVKKIWGNSIDEIRFYENTKAAGRSGDNLTAGINAFDLAYLKFKQFNCAEAKKYLGFADIYLSEHCGYLRSQECIKAPHKIFDSGRRNQYRLLSQVLRMEYLDKLEDIEHQTTYQYTDSYLLLYIIDFYLPNSKFNLDRQLFNKSLHTLCEQTDLNNDWLNRRYRYLKYINNYLSTLPGQRKKQLEFHCGI